MFAEFNEFFNNEFNWDTICVPVYRDSIRTKQIIMVEVGDALVSLPHFSYGLYIKNGFKDHPKYYFKETNYKLELSDKNIKWEIRSFNQLSPFVNKEKITCFLHLMKNPTNQFEAFSKKLRYNIRKAYKNKIKVKTGEIDFVHDWYKIYSKNMHRLGSPPLRKSFFINLIKSFPTNTKIFLAYYNEKPIGGLVYFEIGKRAEIPWASSLNTFNHLNTNYLIYWEAIKHSINRNISIFSFGRSSKTSSTLIFKRHWKPIEKQIFFNKSHRTHLNIKKFRILSFLWKLTPYRLTILLGPVFAKKVY